MKPSTFIPYCIGALVGLTIYSMEYSRDQKLQPKGIQAVIKSCQDEDGIAYLSTDPSGKQQMLTCIWDIEKPTDR